MSLPLICPGCKTKLTVGEDRAGTTFACPKCSASINVPVIVLCDSATGEPVVPSRRAASQAAPLPEQAGEVEREGDDPVKQRLSRQRERRARRRLLLLASACLVLGIAAVVTVAAAVGRWQDTRRARDERAQVVPKTPGAVPADAKSERPAPKPPANRPASPTTSDLTASPPFSGGSDPPTGAPPGRPTEAGTGEPPVPDPPRPVDQPAPKPPVTPAPAPAPVVPDSPPVPKRPFKSDRPAKEVFPGYYLRTTAKFTVYVSRLAYENSDDAEGEPLKMLDEELTRIAELFPLVNLKVLRAVPIWVEWDHVIPKSVPAFACYYFAGTGEKLRADGVDPRKAGCVCVLSLKKAHALRLAGKRQNVLLHELAHAVHDKALGLDNATVRNAYEQAMARRLYKKVKHDDGGERDAYATTNAPEYFAELTCAYLDRLDYLPHTAKELKEYDSVGYELMTKVYGTPEQIAAAKKKEPVKKKDTDK